MCKQQRKYSFSLEVSHRNTNKRKECNLWIRSPHRVPLPCKTGKSGPGLNGSVGWNIVLWTKRSWVRFPVRAHVWVVGLVPVGARTRVNLLIFLSHIGVPLSLLFAPSKIKKYVPLWGLKNKRERETKSGRGDKELNREIIEAVGTQVRSGEQSPCDCEHAWLSLKISWFGGSQTWFHIPEHFWISLKQLMQLPVLYLLISLVNF